MKERRYCPLPRYRVKQYQKINERRSSAPWFPKALALQYNMER